jgi:toxin ParE1/3/4
MKLRSRVMRSRLASADIDSAIAYYCGISPQLARKFIDALEQATLQVAQFPNIGSPRYESELSIPHLRHLPLRGFPYAIFYLVETGVIRIIRLVQMQRDIPELLR